MKRFLVVLALLVSAAPALAWHNRLSIVTAPVYAPIYQQPLLVQPQALLVQPPQAIFVQPQAIQQIQQIQAAPVYAAPIFAPLVVQPFYVPRQRLVLRPY